MDFKKNDLIDEVLNRYYNTFSLTLNTYEFVPEEFNHEILKIIFKEMKKSFKRVNKEYRKLHKEECFSKKMQIFFIQSFGKMFSCKRKEALKELDTSKLIEEFINLEKEGPAKPGAQEETRLMDEKKENEIS